MANNIRRSYNDRGYNSYSGNRRTSDYNPYNRSDNYSGKRRSQVKKLIKGDILYLSGWKIGSKAGFRTFFVAPAKSPKTRVSKSGKNWVSCRVSVTNKTHGTNGIFAGWMDTANHRVFVRELGLMLNPQTGFISYLSKK